MRPFKPRCKISKWRLRRRKCGRRYGKKGGKYLRMVRRRKKKQKRCRQLEQRQIRMVERQRKRRERMETAKLNRTLKRRRRR